MASRSGYPEPGVRVHITRRMLSRSKIATLQCKCTDWQLRLGSKITKHTQAACCAFCAGPARGSCVPRRDAGHPGVVAAAGPRAAGGRFYGQGQGARHGGAVTGGPAAWPAAAAAVHSCSGEFQALRPRVAPWLSSTRGFLRLRMAPTSYHAVVKSFLTS